MNAFVEKQNLSLFRSFHVYFVN